MNDMVLGVFKEREEAENAIEQLEAEGYSPKDISIVMKDTVEGTKLVDKTGAHMVAGVASGAATGGTLGAIAGLLIGVGTIVVPGIGALLIGGPIAAALGLTGAAATTVSGAVTGALAGGLVGGLMALGLPEKEAKVYQQEVESGAILVAVPAKAQGENAKSVLEKFGATKVRIIPGM